MIHDPDRRQAHVAELVALTGASVYDLNPNRGKAGALAAAIQHFALAERFEVVMLLDADTVLSADYMRSSLNMFDDPDVVAIAGRAATVWDKSERLGFVGSLLRAYRERLYVLFQVLLKYGQASRLHQRRDHRAGLRQHVPHADPLLDRHRRARAGDRGLQHDLRGARAAAGTHRVPSPPRHRLHPGPAQPARLQQAGRAVEPRLLADVAAARPAPGPLLVPPGRVRGRGAHQQRRVRDARSGTAAERRRTAVAVARRPRRRHGHAGGERVRGAAAPRRAARRGAAGLPVHGDRGHCPAPRRLPVLRSVLRPAALCGCMVVPARAVAQPAASR